jgi:hypothetical protein
MTTIEKIPTETAQKALVWAAGRPYVLLAVTDEEAGTVELISQGFGAEQIIAGLREAADHLESGLYDQGDEPS